MPFLGPETPEFESAFRAAPVIPETEISSAVDAFNAAFMQDNIIGNAIDHLQHRQEFEAEEGYHPFPDIKDTPYEQDYADSFVGSKSRAETDHIKAQIDREVKRSETIANAGFGGMIAAMAAGTIDPTIALPGGAIYRSYKSGQAALKSAASVGVAAGAGVALQEATLQSMQETRTPEEAGTAIATGVLLGGILGGGASKLLSRAEFGAVSKQLNDYADVMQAAEQDFIPSPVGSDVVDTRQARLKDEATIKKLYGINYQDPMIRGQLRSSTAARRATNDLAESPLEMAENVDMVPTSEGGSVESNIKLWTAPLGESVQATSDLFSKYYYGREVGRVARAAAPIKSEFTKGSKLSYGQFKQEVGKALRRGDKHHIPEVEEAAKIYRAKVFEPGKRAAIDAELLPEGVDVKTADSYLTRVYNRQLIEARRNQFKDILLKHFQAQQAKAQAVSNRLRSEGAQVFKGLSEEETKDLIALIKESRKLGDPSLRNYPALDMIRDAGGVRIGSELDAELRRMDVTPRRFPGLFKKDKGVGAVDNFERDPEGIFGTAEFDLNDPNIDIYVSQDEFLDAVRNEVSGFPNRTVDQEISLRERDALDENISESLSRLGLNENASVADIRKLLKANASKISEAEKIEARIGDFSEQELAGAVDETIDQILGMHPGRTGLDLVQGPRGPLRERVLNIPDVEIEEFLESDIEAVSRIYTRTMSADVELSRKFNGDLTLENEVLPRIRDEYNQLIDKAKTEKERTRLWKEKDQAISDIEAMRDRLRGTYGNPDNVDGVLVRTGRVVRNLNYLRLLGGMTISALPDMAKPVFTHGLGRAWNDGVMSMVKNMDQFKIAANEVRAAGTAWDMALDSRTMAIADIMDDYGRNTSFERGVTALSSKFGVVSLMAPWNAFMKEFSGVMVMNRMLRALENPTKISAADKRLLASSGISQNLAEQISKQFKAHGSKVDGIYVANAGEWTGDGAEAAKRAFRSAVVRDVDRVIVTPGQDKPLWMSKEWGKMIGQFKSFGVSSVQKTLLAGLQQRDAATLSGTILMLTMGAMSYAIKEKLAGREVSTEPNVIMANAFDRSGLAGWLMDVNNIMEKYSGGRIGMSAITGEQISRYQSRNLAGAFLGPTADAMMDAAQITSSFMNGDMRESDYRKAQRMLPFQNLFYLRLLMEKADF